MNSRKNKDCSLYICGKLLIINPKSDDILLAFRNKTDFYEPVGGRLYVDIVSKKSESIEECVIRECYEETKLKISHIDFVGTYHYFWSNCSKSYSFCLLYSTFVESDFNFSENIVMEEEKSCSIRLVKCRIKDILEKKILFNPSHIGLENLIIKILK